jgi:hypothetical protein
MSDSSVEAALEIRDFLDTLLLIAKHDRAPMRALAPRSKPARSCRITSIRPIGMTHPPTGRDRAEGEGQKPDWIKTVSPSGELSADPRVGLTVHILSLKANGNERPNDARADAGATGRYADQRC